MQFEPHLSSADVIATFLPAYIATYFSKDDELVMPESSLADDIGVITGVLYTHACCATAQAITSQVSQALNYSEALLIAAHALSSIEVCFL